MRRTLTFVVLAMVAMLGAALVPASSGLSSDETASGYQAATPITSAPSYAANATVAAPRPKATRKTARDPYAGWAQWCEPLDYDFPCKTADDCSEIQHVSGRPLRCVHPYWAKHDPDYKICAPGYSTRMERRWREARLREIVGQLYFDESEQCADWSWEPVLSKRGNVLRYERRWENGRPTHRQFWKCTRQQGPAQKLTRFLNVVYGRETSKRPWKRHRLDEDPNRNSWVGQAEKYGWQIELKCSNGRSKCRKAKLVVAGFEPDPDAPQHNPHYGDRWRWQYGLGGYGKNSALGAQDWDPMAPPEILCLEVPGTEAYLRDARTAVRKYTSGRPPTCRGEPFRGKSRKGPSSASPQGEWLDHPSWIDVHRVASQGYWCPKGTQREAQKEAMFRARMDRGRLDPDEPVYLEMLGEEIAREGQNETAESVRRRLDRVLPNPWKELARKQAG